MSSQRPWALGIIAASSMFIPVNINRSVIRTWGIIQISLVARETGNECSSSQEKSNRSPSCISEVV